MITVQVVDFTLLGVPKLQEAAQNIPPSLGCLHNHQHIKPRQSRTPLPPPERGGKRRPGEMMDPRGVLEVEFLQRQS